MRFTASPLALQCPWPPLNAPGVAGRRKRDGMGLGLLGLAAAAGWPLMKRACMAGLACVWLLSLVDDAAASSACVPSSSLGA